MTYQEPAPSPSTAARAAPRPERAAASRAPVRAHTSSEAAPPNPNTHLWAAARAALDFMAALFGAPAALACLQLVIGARRADMLAWLRPAERLIRQLLYLEAAAHIPAPRQASQSPRQPAPNRPRAAAPTAAKSAIDPERPETWPAHFQIFTARRRAQAAPTHRPGLRAGLHGAFALARRWQAALRVLEDPAPYARRLARRLSRDGPAESALLHALTRAPPKDAGPCIWAMEEAALRIAVLPEAVPDTS